LNRTTLFIAVLALYGAVLGRSPGARLFGPKALDPFAPRPKTVEQLIAAARFADALPLAVELRANYPDEPLVAYWLATINHAVGRPETEAAAWGEYVRLSKAPADACPAWPDALTRAGAIDQARTASDRCAELSLR
jgi:hypothetical protein